MEPDVTQIDRYSLIYWFPLLAFLASVAGTGWLRRYALRHSLLDIPNHRSLHAQPTPRGGGLALALVCLLAIAWLTIIGWLPGVLALAVLPAATLVTAIGWVDDHRSLPAWLRAVGYLLAAIWLVWVVVAQPPGLTIDGWQGILRAALLVFAIAWLTNLYNFMDGSDGLAGAQAVLAGLAGGVLFWWQGAPGFALLAWVVAMAAAGFLAWNWPPARIFMGDAGSCLLGFLFAALALLGELLADLPALLWVILLGFFIWDASLTLCMRLLRRERWYSAHRSHAYQRLVQLGFSHGQLLWLFIVFNLLLLWPLAWWAYRTPAALIPAVLLSAAVMGLIWLAVQVYHRRVFPGDWGLAKT